MKIIISVAKIVLIVMIALNALILSTVTIVGTATSNAVNAVII